MPTLIFLVIAFQIQNIKWRYLFITLTAICFVFNVYHGLLTQEIYSWIMLMLLFMLTPYFSLWWQKRNARNNPVSFWDFVKDTYLVARLNKYKLLFWILFLVVSITGVFFFAGFTNEALLSWLLAVFILIFGLKKLFRLILPPEWFLHDINTNYVFLSVLIAYWSSNLINNKLSANFIIPAILVAVICVTALFLIRKNTRYLIPGCALILADILWQCVRLIQNNSGYPPSFILTMIVLVITMLIGLVWLIKKPGVLPIAYLALFQLFRFSNFTYEAMGHVIANDLSLYEVTAYAIYLVCWMYIVPLLFWMIGLIQVKGSESINTQQRPSPRLNKLYEALKRKV